MRADFYGEVKARISSLFQVVANKMNLPNNLPLGLMMSSGGAAQSVSPGNTPLSEGRVKICIERDVHIIPDGEEYSNDGIGFLGRLTDLEYCSKHEGITFYLRRSDAFPIIKPPTLAVWSAPTLGRPCSVSLSS